MRSWRRPCARSKQKHDSSLKRRKNGREKRKQVILGGGVGIKPGEHNAVVQASMSSSDAGASICSEKQPSRGERGPAREIAHSLGTRPSTYGKFLNGEGVTSDIRREGFYPANFRSSTGNSTWGEKCKPRKHIDPPRHAPL